MPCKVAVLLTLMQSVLLSNSIAQASKHLKAEKALTQFALKQNLGDDLKFHVREFETAVRNDKDSGLIGLMVPGKFFKVNKEIRKAAEGHLTEFGNVCRQSEKLYSESREELFSRIPDFLDWKRQEVKVPFSSATNTYEVRVIFTPADGGKEYVAILISANKNLVENLKVDASKGKRVMEWKRREGSMVTDRGRFDGHIQNQVAFVLEAEAERKDSIHEYLTAIDLDAVSQAIVSRLKQNTLADPQEKSTGGDKSETANPSEQSERTIREGKKKARRYRFKRRTAIQAEF